MHRMHKFIIYIGFYFDHSGHIGFMNNNIIKGIAAAKIVSITFNFTDNQKTLLFNVFTRQNFIKSQFYINGTEVYQKAKVTQVNTQ